MYSIYSRQMYWPIFASVTLEICKPGRVCKISFEKYPQKLCATSIDRQLIWLSYVRIFGCSIFLDTSQQGVALMLM